MPLKRSSSCWPGCGSVSASKRKKRADLTLHLEILELKHGWGIMVMGSVWAPKHPDKGDTVLKVRRCSKEELLAVLEDIEDQQLIDLRETKVYPG